MSDGWDSSLQRSLGRIEGKQDMLMIEMKAIHVRLDEHDRRLRGVEETSAKRGAIFAGMAGVLAAVGTWLVNHFMGRIG